MGGEVEELLLEEDILRKREGEESEYLVDFAQICPILTKNGNKLAYFPASNTFFALKKGLNYGGRDRQLGEVPTRGGGGYYRTKCNRMR